MPPIWPKQVFAAGKHIDFRGKLPRSNHLILYLFLFVCSAQWMIRMYETKKIYDTRVFIQLSQADFERPAIGEIVTLNAKTHAANSSYPYVKVSSEFKEEWKIFTQK